jgi:hypothetical protein
MWNQLHSTSLNSNFNSCASILISLYFQWLLRRLLISSEIISTQRFFSVLLALGFASLSRWTFIIQLSETDDWVPKYSSGTLGPNKSTKVITCAFLER